MSSTRPLLCPHNREQGRNKRGRGRDKRTTSSYNLTPRYACGTNPWTHSPVVVLTDPRAHGNHRLAVHVDGESRLSPVLKRVGPHRPLDVNRTPGTPRPTPGPMGSGKKTPTLFSEKT